MVPEQPCAPIHLATCVCHINTVASSYLLSTSDPPLGSRALVQPGPACSLTVLLRLRLHDEHVSLVLAGQVRREALSGSRCCLVEIQGRGWKGDCIWSRRQEAHLSMTMRAIRAEGLPISDVLMHVVENHETMHHADNQVSNLTT
jgi:hypothetical protein